jgi:hypothetical protein
VDHPCIAARRVARAFDEYPGKERYTRARLSARKIRFFEKQ